jgi:hypothetical protein
MAISIDFAEAVQTKPLPVNHKTTKNRASKATSTFLATVISGGFRAAEILLYMYVFLTCGFLAGVITIVVITVSKIAGLVYLVKLLFTPLKKSL